MGIEYVPVLADAMREYYQAEELIELAGMFDVSAGGRSGTSFHFALSREVLTRIEQGNNRRFLQALLGSLLSRAREGVAKTDWEVRRHHEGMLAQLQKLEAMLERAWLPEELSVPEDSPFLAKSEVREFLGAAETTVTIVDNYVGPGTLDFLRDVGQPIMLLTGEHNQAIAPGFDRALREFVAEARTIVVRQHPKLHDRYILFNQRCWVVGSSLKDAGKKAFNVIECVDGRQAISAEVERKWKEAKDYQP